MLEPNSMMHDVTQWLEPNSVGDRFARASKNASGAHEYPDGGVDFPSPSV
jgi:hypothetical protein